MSDNVIIRDSGNVWVELNTIGGRLVVRNVPEARITQNMVTGALRVVDSGNVVLETNVAGEEINLRRNGALSALNNSSALLVQIRNNTSCEESGSTAPTLDIVGCVPPSPPGGGGL